MSKIQLEKNIFIAVILFSILPQVTSDMYNPALPEITQTLKTSPFLVQFSISIFMLGYSISQLVYGPISDIIGRKRPLVAGITINILGSLICLLSTNIYLLLAGRLIQGIGVAACICLRRAFLRDLFQETELTKIISRISMVLILLVAAGPILGSYLQLLISWRAIFLMLTFYSCLVLLAVLKIIPANKGNNLKTSSANKKANFLQIYTLLLYDRKFLGYCLLASLYYGGGIAYYTVAPYILQDKFNLTPVQYSYLNIFLACSLVLACYVNSILVTRLDQHTLFSLSGLCMLLAGMGMLIMLLLGYQSIWSIILFTSLFLCGAAILYLNSLSNALTPFPTLAGAAGSLFGAIQVLGGGVASIIMTIFYRNHFMPLALCFISAGILSLIVYNSMIKRCDFSNIS